MFYSMTGYGNGIASRGDLEVLCESKSVNNRFVEISFSGYSVPKELEEYVKSQRKKKVLRVSFEVKINDNFQYKHAYEINQLSLKNLKDSLNSSKDFNSRDLRLSDLKDIPGLLVVKTFKKKLKINIKKISLQQLLRNKHNLKQK